MISTGIDIVEIDRIKKLIKNPRFLTRVFSLNELDMLRERVNFTSSAAAGWCAKEAFAKSLGTGIRNFQLREVELMRDKMGAPYLRLGGNAKRIADEKGFDHFSVSVTHTKKYACAMVIAYNEGAAG